MSIYCTRGQHHRCEQCDCGCHPEEENVTYTLPDEDTFTLPDDDGEDE